MEGVPKINKNPEAALEQLTQMREQIKKLRKEAYEDYLTGLENRRAYEETLKKFLEENYRDELDEFLKKLDGNEEEIETHRSPEKLGKGSVLVLDIDKFSEFNNEHGHKVGDVVLQKFAETVRGTLNRKKDLAFRFGGEEFVVLCPDTDEVGARILADRIRTAVENLKIDVKGKNEPLGVTVSIGVAQIIEPEIVEGEHAEYSESRLKETSREDVAIATGNADVALYAAKAEGRNQVRTYADMLEGLAYTDEDLDNDS